MNERAHVLRNAFIHSAGRILSIAIGIVTVGLTTRLLAPEGYGVLTTALSYLQLFGILMDVGLTLTLNQQLSSSGESNRAELVGNAWSLRLLLSLGAMTLALLILPFFHYSTLTNTAILLGSLTFIIYSFQQLFTSVFQHLGRSSIIVASEMSGRILTLLFTIWVWRAGGSVLEVIAATIIGNAVTLFVMTIESRRQLHWRIRWNANAWKNLLTHSWPVGLSIAFNLIYFKADTVLLSQYYPAEIVGIYGAPYKILEVLIGFPPLLLGLLLPKLAASWVKRDLQEFQQWFTWGWKLIVAGALPMLVGGILMSERIIVLVAGEQFGQSAPLLSILLIATVFIYCSSLFGYTIVAMKKQRQMIWGYALTAVVSLLGYLWFIPRYGSQGAAWMTVAAELIIAILTFVVIRQAAHVHLAPRELWQPLIGTIIMGIVVFFIQSLIPSWLTIFISIIVYLGILFISGFIPRESITQLLRNSIHTTR